MFNKYKNQKIILSHLGCKKKKIKIDKFANIKSIYNSDNIYWIFLNKQIKINKPQIYEEITRENKESILKANFYFTQIKVFLNSSWIKKNPS